MLKALFIQLKSDFQSTLHTNNTIIDSKNLTISTQIELIKTQNDLIEFQKSKLQSEPSNQQQHIFTSTNIDAEEKERRRCIVIAKFPESSKTTPSERIEEDNKNVKLLLDEMEIEANVIETFRMGSKKNSESGEIKHRLLKVRLQTSGQAKNVLRNAKNIKKSTTFKDHKILLRKSMCADERKFEKEIFKKQKERIAELQKSKPHNEYTIYAGKICIKNNGGKPTKINDPLNDAKFSKPNSNSLQTPIKNQSFLSSSPTPVKEQ
uniref:Uncharacterized protein n=1 Tax=Panagrolaimus sp. PS1159 TaxID=55785 RepID=A0AC35FAT9_9BILA